MWSVARTSVLLAAAMVVFAGGTASAAAMDVKVPFTFIAGGRTMPAGQYHIEREGTNTVLIRGEKGVRDSVYVFTVPVTDRDPSGQKPALAFIRHESQYRLADIWESGGQGRKVSGS